MNKTVLITGASAGIGYEFSRVFAANGYDLVLVSRNRPRLEAVAGAMQNRYAVRATVMAADLAEANAPRELHDAVVSAGIDLQVLVNNAGFGTCGKFTEIETGRHLELIQLNITSLTELCKLFGAAMVKKRSGRILNVASTAAFQAGPYMSTYYASKAYVLLLSEALHQEFAPEGVTVTVLCPGPTRTEFFERSAMLDTPLAQSPHMMKAADVARAGFEGLMQGKRLVIPGVINKLLALAVRVLPRAAVASLARSLNRKESLRPNAPKR